MKGTGRKGKQAMKGTEKKVERASAGILGEAYELQGMKINVWVVKRAGSRAQREHWIWAVSATHRSLLNNNFGSGTFQ